VRPKKKSVFQKRALADGTTADLLARKENSAQSVSEAALVSLQQLCDEIGGEEVSIGFLGNSGSFAMLAAIRRASSRVSGLPGDRGSALVERP